MKRIFFITILSFYFLGCSSQSRSLEDYFEHFVEVKDYYTHVYLESDQGIVFSVYSRLNNERVYAGFILEYKDLEVGDISYQYNLSEDNVDVYRMKNANTIETICFVDSNTRKDNNELIASCDDEQTENVNKVIDAYNKILEDTDSTKKDILNYTNELAEKYDDN